MRMENARKTITAALLIGVMALLGGALTATAGEDVCVLPGKYLEIRNVEVDADGAGFVFTGEVDRRDFSPRRPLRGLVEATVVDANGAVLVRKTVKTAQAFVPKGVRTVGFAGRLAGDFGPGARLVLTPIS